MRHVIALLTLVFLVAGCGSVSPQKATFRATGTTVIAVETAMKGWFVYVKAGKATPSDEAHVRDAYSKYQTSMHAVIDLAKTATTITNQTSLDLVITSAAAAQAHLIEAITQFIPPKELTK